MRWLTTITVVGALGVAAATSALAQQTNPCAAKDPATPKARSVGETTRPAAVNPRAAEAPGASPRMQAEIRRPGGGDARFGAGPALRPRQAP